MVQGLLADRDDVFGGSFDINSDESCVSLFASDYYFALELLVKWQLTKLWSQPVSVIENLGYVFLVVKEELDKAHLESLSFWLVHETFFVIIALDPNIAVGVDALINKLLEFGQDLESISEAMRVVVEGIIVMGRDLVTNLILSDAELAFCQGASFSDADVMKHGAVLNRSQVFD